jgi:hypothetical protein
MSGARRWLPLAAATLLAGAFAYLNRGETAILRLGITSIYQAPVVGVAFVAFLLGMLTMLVFGLRQDLRTRRLLREHGLLDEANRPAAPPPRAYDYEPAPHRYDEPDAAL